MMRRRLFNLHGRAFIIRPFCFILVLMRPAIILMVKAPRAGLVKTRLAPQLSASGAASLAACFLQDAAENARRVSTAQLIIAYDPPHERALLETLLRPGPVWVEQQGRDLGARLKQVVARAFDLGFGPAVVIGADSPTLPREHLETAIRSLMYEADETIGAADVVLGPTSDGGFYLIGLRAPASGLFINVRWSTPEACRDTAANAERAGLRLLRLPDWYDVDLFADLLRLRQELFTDEAARRRAPATHRWLLAHPLPPHAPK